jgi:hypothetical protein
MALQPKGSSLHSQEPATGTYPQAVESTPLPPNLFTIHFDPILSSMPQSSE